MVAVPRRHALTLANMLPESGSHEVVFYDWGSETATHVVVCVHGLTRNARDFDFLAQTLVEQGKRVFALNMPGRGESAWLADPTGYHYGSYVSDCLAIMNNFHLRGVEWVGTSMGGIIGMAIAAQHPGRIRKLVLNDIGTFLPKAALARIYGYLQQMPRRFDSADQAHAFLREIFKPFNISDPALWEHFLRHSLREDGGIIRLACDPDITVPLARDTKNFTEINDVNLSDLWDKIDIPTLIIRGALSDILDVETVSAMRATNPKAQSVTIDGVGHAPPLATPDQIRIVSDWLNGGAFIRGL